MNDSRPCSSAPCTERGTEVAEWTHALEVGRQLWVLQDWVAFLSDNRWAPLKTCRFRQCARTSTTVASSTSLEAASCNNRGASASHLLSGSYRSPTDVRPRIPAKRVFPQKIMSLRAPVARRTWPGWRKRPLVDKTTRVSGWHTTGVILEGVSSSCCRHTKFQYCGRPKVHCDSKKKMGGKMVSV